MAEVEDQQTLEQAYIIAHQYNFCPQTPLKCERTTPEGYTRTLFFANTSNRIKILIKYERDQLDALE